MGVILIVRAGLVSGLVHTTGAAVCFCFIDLPDHWSMLGFVSWVMGSRAALYGLSRRWCHPWGIAVAVRVLLGGFCNAEAVLQVTREIAPYLGLLLMAHLPLVVLFTVFLPDRGCSRRDVIVAFTLHDLLSDGYKRSLPAGATSHGARTRMSTSSFRC